MRAQWRYAEQTREWVLATWAEDGAPLEVYGSAAAGSLTAIAPQLRDRVAEAMRQQHGIRPPAEVFDGEPGAEVTMTCPACWRVTWAVEAARARVCAFAGEHPPAPVPAGEPGGVHSGQSS